MQLYLVPNIHGLRVWGVIIVTGEVRISWKGRYKYRYSGEFRENHTRVIQRNLIRV